MWYLQGNTFLIISIFSLAVALLRKLCPRRIINVLLPIIEIGILFFISSRLAIFYIAYIIMGLVFSRVLFKARKKVLFALFSIIATIPLFISRADSFGIELPFLFVSIGIAFQMLK